MKNLKSRIIVYSFLSFLLLTGFFSLVVLAADSRDAIAVRIMPNTEHYSATRWYKERGFKGSPQSLTVDGYEAVRDGRTVYISVANINSDSNTLYTNIYLISYNQEAAAETTDIFGSILSHWKFNTNLSGAGTCSVTVDTACAIDSDCPVNEICSSEKAKVIRDTKRLADLAELKISLNTYKESQGKYPTIKSGSYLPNITLSTWPSWQKILAQELGGSDLPIDPINKLGNCGDDSYNPITCWSEQTKTFADRNPGDSVLDLPADSFNYVYTGTKSGKSYDLCAVMETSFDMLTTGSCAGSNAVRVEITETNHAPVFTSINLPSGISGQAYVGFLEAEDPDGDDITWSLTNEAGGTWQLQDITSLPNQKRVISNLVTISGVNTFTVRISDDDGGVTTQSFTVVVSNSAPVVNIVSPSTNDNYIAGQDSANLSGTVASVVAITQVNWTNNRGGGGTASGGKNWSAGSIALQPGENVVTVTATDSLGNTGIDTITINFNNADYFLRGFAWSPNIGWISFSSDNCDTDNNNFIDTGMCGGDNSSTPVVEYNVVISRSTGEFSGQAWCANVGWISFDRSDTGNPPQAPFSTGSGNIAEVDLNSTLRNINGWAKIMSFGDQGWIKLRDSGFVSAINSNSELTGYGWNGNDDGTGIGWISFNCADFSICNSLNYRVYF